jgi:hypothetical protein
MYINCPLKNNVAFKITIDHFNQMVILKVTSFFDGHLMYI